MIYILLRVLQFRVMRKKRQVEVETEQGKRTISKNGIIAMRKATNKSKTNHSNEHGVEDVDVVTGERRNNVTKDKKGY